MRLVIMGNGVAGITTINLVRRARPDVDIVIYSQEPHHYNPRPRLMDVLADDVPPRGHHFATLKVTDIDLFASVRSIHPTG